MIKAVIFDCFGVLVREGWFAFLDDYFAHDDHKRQQAIDGMSRMGAGLIGHDEFIAELAELAGISYQQTEDILTDNPCDDKLFSYIEHNLKGHYKIGMLSNAGADRTEELFGGERVKLFDEIVLSYQVGMVKPDPAIYELIAHRLGVTPSECLFIDDQERYCIAAENVGMKSIRHADINTDATVVAMKELLHA